MSSKVRAKSPRRTTTTCRSYSEDPNSGKIFTVASAVRVSASIGSPIRPQNVPRCAPSFSANFATTTPRSKATTKPPSRIHSISFDCPPGPDHLSSPGLQCLQGRLSLAAQSPRLSIYPRPDRPGSQRGMKRLGERSLLRKFIIKCIKEIPPTSIWTVAVSYFAADPI
jgi:hypothetical protein